ncbi:unnamed protein product, partial [Mesorhabditis spiculigera]
MAEPGGEQPRPEDDLPGSSQRPPNEDPDRPKDMWDCHICLDTAQHAVVTLCGHLFCWNCLSQWLETRPNQVCPVCKSVVQASNVIPIYGRGGDQSDPRQQTPPRPRGQRQEPTHRHQGLFGDFGGGGGGGGVHFSLGIGVFPFGIFAQMMRGGGGGGGEAQAGEAGSHAPPGSQNAEVEQMLSNGFSIIAVLAIAWLLFF